MHLGGGGGFEADSGKTEEKSVKPSSSWLCDSIA